jgi:signal transduction histidine kinase
MKLKTIILALTLSSNCSAQDSSHYFVRHFDTDNGLPQNTIKGMEMDSRGYLWLLTEAGIVRFDGQRLKAYDRLSGGNPLVTRLSGLHKLADDTILANDADTSAFIATNFGTLTPCKFPEWIKKDRKIFNFTDISTRCYSKVVSREQPAWILPSFRLNDMVSGKGLKYLKGIYYWFNDRNELVSADSSLTRFARVVLKGFPKIGDPGQQVKLVPGLERFVVQWGQWLCTACLKDPVVLVADRIIFVGDIGPVTNLIESKNSNGFFVGTLSNGLFQYTRQDFYTKLFKGNSSNVIYAQAPFGDNDVLTNKGILTGNSIPQLDSFRPFMVTKTRTGSYVLSKWGHRTVNGLSFFDSTLHQYDFLPIPSPAVGLMYELSDGSFCISALGNYFGRVCNRSIEWFSNEEPMKSFQVAAIAESTPGLLWIAGPQGLARFDIHSHLFKKLPGLEGLSARTIYLDSLGMLWIGTYGNGIYVCVNDKIIKMPLDPNGYLEHTHAFLVDKNGFCWISTNRGLFQASISAMQDFANGHASAVYYHYYDKSNGFLTNEFNGGCYPSAVVTRKGLFSFPSMDGVVQFDPVTVHPILANSNVYIDRIATDSQIFQSSDQVLSLPNSARRIDFSVSSPYWGIAENNFIEYRLIGVDSSWRPIHDDGIISFEGLSSGSYQLELRKRYGFKGQQVMKRQVLVIEYAFYRKWWFKFVVVFISLLLLWLAAKLRFRYLTRIRKQLENEVVLRTREQERLIEELTITVEDLESSQSELSKRTRLLEMVSMTISHDLQSPLRFLTEVSANLHAETLDINKPALKVLSEDVLNASSNIHRFVRDFGYWVKSLEHRFEVNLAHVDLDSLLKEVAVFSKDFMHQKGNTLYITGKRDIVIETDRQLLQTILRNLVDNANKHTSNGHITLEVGVRHQQGSIIVSDSGRGFQNQSLSVVRDILRNSYNGIGAVKENRGFGYYFVSDFSRLLNINVSIENLPGGGAAIVLENMKIINDKYPVTEKTHGYDKNSIG